MRWHANMRVARLTGPALLAFIAAVESSGASLAGLVVGLAGSHGSVAEGDVEVGVREQLEMEFVAVDVVVVTVTEQHQVVEVGWAVVAPVVDVVGITPGDCAVTSREAAAAIANSDSTEQVFGHGVDRSPVVQDGVAGA